VKSLIDLLQSVLEESGTQCGISTDLDSKTIQARFEHEGLSFLTITLPQFGKDLQRALTEQKVSSSHFVGFPRRGQIPVFLSGFLAQVFDPMSGDLLNEYNLEAIRAVLQVTGLLSKVELECTDKRIQAAFDKYVETENEVRDSDKMISKEMLRDFISWTHLIFGDLLRNVQLDIQGGNLMPNHGPGAVADRLVGNDKWNQAAWPDRLEAVFPFGRYAYSSWSLYLDDFDSGGRPSLPGTELPTRVIAVPKTMKTPRIIAIEPAYMQYIQQGIHRLFVRHIRIAKFGALVNYESQLPNQEMARIGSYNGSIATLDLSEASDRVSNQLVRALLRDFPVLYEAVDACRSRSADVPGHGVIRLAKFASMGSALCFPIESLVFLVITMMGYYKGTKEDPELDTPQNRLKFLNYFGREVRTYGDDIIVPSRYAQAVSDELESFGLRVNRHKSFWTGKFRESCGKEYFAGDDVTIVKCRAELPSKQQPSSELVHSIVSTSSLRNLLFEYGYWRTCKQLDTLLEGFIPYPAVGPDSPALGRLSSLGYQSERWDADLQVPLVRAVAVKAKSPVSILNGPGALMKYFAKDSE